MCITDSLWEYWIAALLWHTSSILGTLLFVDIYGEWFYYHHTIVMESDAQLSG